MSRRSTRSVRCEMVSEYTKGDYPHGPWRIHGRRCRCIISEDKGALTSGDGFDVVNCCDNHWKVLHRGKLLVDYHGRVWRWNEEKGLYKTGTTNSAHPD